MSGVTEKRGHPADTAATPGLASGCHVMLQNHEGTGPAAGRGSYLGGSISVSPDTASPARLDEGQS